MLAPRPTITLYTLTPVAPETRKRLRLLVQARCGPCVLMLRRTDDPWATATVYSLTGPWRLSETEVHRHLVSIFDLLVSP